ncbi:RING finger family protein [Striga asiatica]|uniref:RING finger family protein n=1 Tax=Striga asiatica TaxID=4170 RepID=A0A5A7RGM1_STRAF|nr:RING finger family protein [Striga asiatica]
MSSCLWAPLVFAARTALRISAFLLDPHGLLETGRPVDGPYWELDLPAGPFSDMGPAHEETCSICLMEFLKEDWVNKLPKCGHVFHVACMDSWLEMCRFTCPLCRSFLPCARSSSPCGERAEPVCVELPELGDDFTYVD